jgi:hypothetical protein
VLDALQVIVVAVLVAVGIASVLIFQRVVSSNILSSGGRTDLDRPSFLIAAMAIVLFIPIILVCSIGSLWLVMVGWEGFERTLMLSIGGGLTMGVFMAGFAYIVSVVARRQEQKIEKDMETIERTKRPLPMKYGVKVAFAIPALVLVSVVFGLLMSNFSADKLLWQRIFAYEALGWFVFALVPFIPSTRYQFSFRDPAAKWWLITLMVVAAILVFLSVLVPYVF